MPSRAAAPAPTEADRWSDFQQIGPPSNGFEADRWRNPVVANRVNHDINSNTVHAKMEIWIQRGRWRR